MRYLCVCCIHIKKQMTTIGHKNETFRKNVNHYPRMKKKNKTRIIIV